MHTNCTCTAACSFLKKISCLFMFIEGHPAVRLMNLTARRNTGTAARLYVSMQDAEAERGNQDVKLWHNPEAAMLAAAWLTAAVQ
jgi:hypothetical protein